MREMITILLADDHTLMRACIRALLRQLGSVRVVAEAVDGIEAVRLAKAHRPALVLMDIGMPGIDGIEATARIRRELPDVRVIMMSAHASQEHVAQAARAGASAYVRKGAATRDLPVAIEAVMQGGAYASPGLSQLGVDASALNVAAES